MTKQELIDKLTLETEDKLNVEPEDVRMAVDIILNGIGDALAQGKRVEIRGFGSIQLRYRAPKQGRNPKTGQPVQVDGKYFPRFKPGRRLRERVDYPRAI